MCKILIGVISDTHGLMRPEAIQAFKGCDLVIHAGDIGSPDILELLKDTASVVAVRGNVDRGDWAERIPLVEVVKIGNRKIYVLHKLLDLDFDPAAAGYHMVISGHSHKPALEERGGVIYLNPGSAGPKRFNLPVSAALVHMQEGKTKVRLINFY